MRMKQLEYLLALKQYGSFLEAAQKIFVAQPAMSTAIRELEKELGFMLLTRSSKGVEFTSKGEQVLEKAVQIMAIFDEIREIKIDSVENIKGTVEVSCNSRLCRSMIIDACIKLNKLYPNLVINVVRQDVSDILSSLNSFKSNIGLIQIDTVEEGMIQEELKDKRITSGELFKDKMVFAVNKNHPLREKKKIHLSEILSYPYVTAKRQVSEAAKGLLKQYGYQGEIIYIDDVAGLRQFIEQSDAITYMSRTSLRYDNKIYNNNLIPLEVEDFNWQCAVAWVHNREPLSIVEQIIVEALTDICRKY